MPALEYTSLPDTLDTSKYEEMPQGTDNTETYSNPQLEYSEDESETSYEEEIVFWESLWV